MFQRPLLERSPKFALPLLVAFAIISSPGAGQPTFCTPHGEKNKYEREGDPLKNRSDAPPADQFDNSATLDAVIAPGPDLTRWSHDRGAVFEGIVVLVKSGGKEAANCGATDAVHEDTHIELAPSASAPKTQHVIVEVTPRMRAKMAAIADWSTPALKKELTGRRVRVTGWLFDDLIHKGAAENTHPGGKHNWRATVWEIHPITAIQLLPAAAVEIPRKAPAAHHVAHAHSASKRKCTRSNAHVCRRGTRKQSKRSK